MNRESRWSIVIGSLALLIALAAVEWRQASPPWREFQPDGPVRTLIPAISDEPELCLTCHFGIEEISPSHPVDVFGCVACHGGDRLSLDVAEAHADLRGPSGNPADLSVVEQSCGSADCHGGELQSNRNHIARITRSLHTTYASALAAFAQEYDVAAGPLGVVDVAADIYGPPGTLDALAALDPAALESAGAKRFSDNCLHCHLGAAPIDAPGYYRGAGCAACHVPYADDGVYRGADPTVPTDEPGHPLRHALTVVMPSAQCTRCHGRGNYSLQTLAFTPHDPGDNPHNTDTATVCERELDCIDCHNAGEAMGDGYLYANADAAPSVECRTCHGTLEEPPSLVTLDDPNDPAFRRANLNSNYFVHEGDRTLVAPNGEAFGAVRWQDGRLVQTGRVTGRTYSVPLVQGSACQQNIDEQAASDCRACHGA
ncbi:MAG: multiheme c-type cytochrome [Anaerolineales bacterium]